MNVYVVSEWKWDEYFEIIKCFPTQNSAIRWIERTVVTVTDRLYTPKTQEIEIHGERSIYKCTKVVVAVS